MFDSRLSKSQNFQNELGRLSWWNVIQRDVKYETFKGAGGTCQTCSGRWIIFKAFFSPDTFYCSKPGKKTTLNDPKFKTLIHVF